MLRPLKTRSALQKVTKIFTQSIKIEEMKGLFELTKNVACEYFEIGLSGYR